MSQCQQENWKDQNEEIGRQDCFEGYCPRKNDTVVIVSSRCFYPKRDEQCSGCVFDVDFVYVRLILIMSEILEARGN